MTTARQPAGIPTGGQFAASAAPRADVALAPEPGNPTTAYANFDELPETAQQALRHWSHEQSAEEQESWQREQGFAYEIETVPMAEMKARVFDTNADMPDDFGDFDSYHAWFTNGGDTPDHGDSRWPVIEAEPSLDPQSEYLDDGWHRFHSYVNAGDETVDVLRIVR